MSSLYASWMSAQTPSSCFATCSASIKRTRTFRFSPICLVEEDCISSSRLCTIRSARSKCLKCLRSKLGDASSNVWGSRGKRGCSRKTELDEVLGDGLNVCHDFLRSRLVVVYSLPDASVSLARTKHEKDTHSNGSHRLDHCSNGGLGPVDRQPIQSFLDDAQNCLGRS
jgi:hypothetical protein